MKNLIFPIVIGMIVGMTCTVVRECAEPKYQTYAIIEIGSGLGKEEAENLALKLRTVLPALGVDVYEAKHVPGKDPRPPIEGALILRMKSSCPDADREAISRTLDSVTNVAEANLRVRHALLRKHREFLVRRAEEQPPSLSFLKPFLHEQRVDKLMAKVNDIDTRLAIERPLEIIVPPTSASKPSRSDLRKVVMLPSILAGLAVFLTGKRHEIIARAKGTIKWYQGYMVTRDQICPHTLRTDGCTPTQAAPKVVGK